jgi:hypothetical protein
MQKIDRLQQQRRVFGMEEVLGPEHACSIPHGHIMPLAQRKLCEQWHPQTQ